MNRYISVNPWISTRNDTQRVQTMVLFITFRILICLEIPEKRCWGRCWSAGRWPMDSVLGMDLRTWQLATGHTRGQLEYVGLAKVRSPGTDERAQMRLNMWTRLHQRLTQTGFMIAMMLSEFYLCMYILCVL
jgi:hypothetical protein